MKANPAITGHIYLHSPPLSPHSQTDSNSVTSSTILGDLVYPPTKESILQGQVGVRGSNSTDTSSLSGSYDQSAIGSPSTSQQPSIESTGSFHPHAADTSNPDYQLPQCTNPVCASMTFGCFHEDNHCCDLCLRAIRYKEFGFHCPHCDRDYCRTCHPIHWDPISSLDSTQALSSLPASQEIRTDDTDPSSLFPPPSTHTVAPHSQVESED